MNQPNSLPSTYYITDPVLPIDNTQDRFRTTQVIYNGTATPEKGVRQARYANKNSLYIEFQIDDPVCQTAAVQK